MESGYWELREFFNYATLLVIMLSLYMFQFTMLFTIWCIYNDDIVTSIVSQLNGLSLTLITSLEFRVFHRVLIVNVFFPRPLISISIEHTVQNVMFKNLHDEQTPLIRTLHIKLHYIQQLKCNYLAPLHGWTHLVVYHASMHPLGGHWVPNWCPVASHFWHVTMEIIPTLISLHTQITKARLYVRFYTKY